jgi:hypothetical protein
MPPTEHKAWLQTFQELLHYYVPELPPSPALVFGSLAVFCAGLFLVFRSGKSERMVVCCFGFLLGGWIGWQASDLVGTPGPISAAVLGLVLTIIAYRTYRIWLAGGSVVVLFFAATTFQLGRGDLSRYLPAVDAARGKTDGAKVLELPTSEEQQRNQLNQAAVQLEKFKEKVVSELKALGPIGWLLPLAAAVIGGILAFWALRVFTIIWLGLLGAGLAVTSAMTLICAQWPGSRDSIFNEPRIGIGLIAGLWIAGLLLQAKEARLPKRVIKPEGGKPAAQTA